MGQTAVLPRSACALFWRPDPAVGPGDELVLTQLKARLEGAIRDEIAAGRPGTRARTSGDVPE
jgi:hypothetical protein